MKTNMTKYTCDEIDCCKAVIVPEADQLHVTVPGVVLGRDYLALAHLTLSLMEQLRETVPLYRCKHVKAGDGGVVDGCGWQGPRTDRCPGCGGEFLREMSR